MRASCRRAFEALELSAGEYALGDFGRVHTGFMRASVEVLERARLLIAYEDYCAKLNAYGETLFAETFAFYDTLTEEKPE